MNNVIDIDSARPHDTTYIECGWCGYEWIAVHVSGLEQFECKGCRQWVNQYGTTISKHVCAECERSFTLCPASATFGDKCLADDCASYDIARDAEIKLGFKERPKPRLLGYLANGHNDIEGAGDL